MLFLQTTLLNIFGFIILNINLRFMMFSFDFNQLSKNSLIKKLSHYIFIMGGNIKHFYHILHLKESPISLLHILQNVIAILNIVIVILLKPVYLFSPMPPCLCHIGLMFLPLQSILLIICQLPHSNFPHPISNSFSLHLIIQNFVFLGVYVILGYVHNLLINLLLALIHVFFLVTL